MLETKRKDIKMP